MAVGAGSIRRVAKTKIETTEKKPEGNVAKEAVEKVAKPKEAVGKKETVAKPKQASKKRNVNVIEKEITGGKNAKTCESAKEKEAVAEVIKREQNQVCHLTEELPIHLL